VNIFSFAAFSLSAKEKKRRKKRNAFLKNDSSKKPYCHRKDLLKNNIRIPAHNRHRPT
jgi:hypothetical protein